MAPDFWQQATMELSANDLIMHRIIRHSGDLALERRGDAFSTLARAIVGQQISVKAAASVWERVTSALTDISPEKLAMTESDLLRNCGLSFRKISYLQDLSRHFMEEKLNESHWSELDDTALINELTQVKGIGRWTAEMFLIFYLHRPDVLPLDDVGLQRAVGRHYNANQPISKSRIHMIAKNWQPWRSVATWYLWRSLDPIPVVY
jgi:DNA-3-methyladenine glycosylase II